MLAGHSPSSITLKWDTFFFRLTTKLPSSTK
jgi:hypothetical protein